MSVASNSTQPTVVLIHGLFGFRKILWIEYFHHVRPMYEQMGIRVLVPRLPASGSIEQRAQSLALQLADETGPLHLLAHSMGGLDARYYISRLGRAGKVVSLTTLATPHHGSAAADFVCGRLSPFRMFTGVHSLTRQRIQQFNAEIADQPGVVYRSVGAYRRPEEQPWIVRRYGRHLQQQEGDNDGQVAVSSAQWGEYMVTLPCDHFELIYKNLWLNPFRYRKSFDPTSLYRGIGQWVLAFR